jgi:hypothetical protein
MNQSSMSRLDECLERARALEPIITEHAAESEPFRARSLISRRGQIIS